MGECNDPNYGLSDEAVLGPGSLLLAHRAGEERNVPLGSLWEVAAWAPQSSCRHLFPHSLKIKVFCLFLGDHKDGPGIG